MIVCEHAIELVAKAVIVIQNAANAKPDVRISQRLVRGICVL